MTHSPHKRTRRKRKTTWKPINTSKYKKRSKHKNQNYQRKSDYGKILWEQTTKTPPIKGNNDGIINLIGRKQETREK